MKAVYAVILWAFGAFLGWAFVAGATKYDKGYRKDDRQEDAARELRGCDRAWEDRERR